MLFSLYHQVKFIIFSVVFSRFLINKCCVLLSNTIEQNVKQSQQITNFATVKTRGEIRREKNSERIKARRAKAKAVKIDALIEKDCRVKETDIPLRTLEMEEEFDEVFRKHANWLQPIPIDEAKQALAEFRHKVSLDQLRELPCAVCSELHVKDDWKKISVEKIELRLLQVPVELIDQSFGIDFHYGHPLIDNSGLKILLDRDGFIYNQERPSIQSNRCPFDLRICNDCHKSLQEHKTPSLSLVNMWIGPTPPCLQELNIPEQLLISPGYLCVNLMQISNKRHSHQKMKGHVITFPQNPVSLTKVLPLPIYRLCEQLKVVFVGQGTPSERQLKRVLQVRKSKVSAALKWLIKHNILYKNIEVDENALNLLSKGEIPDALRVTTTFVDIDSRNVENYTGYSRDPLDDNEDEDSGDSDDEESTGTNKIGSACELRTSGILHVDNIPVSERERTLLSIEQFVSGSTNKRENDVEAESSLSQQVPTIRMPHSNKPLSEFQNKELFPASFPVLFPYGVGGFDDSKELSLAKYAKHLMRHRDVKFRQHRSFLFVLFNILQRREVLSQCRIMVKGRGFARSTELIAQLKPEDLQRPIRCCDWL